MTKKWMKHSLLKVAEEHRKNCPGEKCTVSLFSLRVTGEKAGLKFTKKEKKVLW